MIAQTIITQLTAEDIMRNPRFSSILGDAGWNLQYRAITDSYTVYNGFTTASMTIQPNISGRSIKIIVKAEPSGSLLEPERLFSDMETAFGYITNIVYGLKDYDTTTNAF